MGILPKELDLPLPGIRDLILGGIEHFCISEVSFGHALAVETRTGQLCSLLFEGIKATQQQEDVAVRPGILPVE